VEASAWRQHMHGSNKSMAAMMQQQLSGNNSKTSVVLWWGFSVSDWLAEQRGSLEADFKKKRPLQFLGHGLKHFCKVQHCNV
jgi:hypothetical protein